MLNDALRPSIWQLLLPTAELLTSRLMPCGAPRPRAPLWAVPAPGQDAQTKNPRPRREGLIQYLRPLIDGEQISLDFYYEQGKFGLSPALGRIAIRIADPQLGLHWITADSRGITSGVEDSNRVVDPQAELPEALVLNNMDWNQLSLRLDGDVATMRINGAVVYRRLWEKEAGRQFGLFHDPSEYHVRVRNMELRGNWPDQLPTQLFEIKP